MRKLIFAILAALSLTTATAQVPPTIPANTFLGRLGIGPGPAQAIPFAIFVQSLSGITNSSLAQMAADTVKCNNTGVLANAMDCTQAQLTALVNPFTSLLSGAVPASGGGTTSFLRADGSWAAPPGAGGGAISVLSQPNVSGSSQSTTGTINATSSSLALASAIDFVNGQGIRVNHAGVAATPAGTAGQAVVTVGAAGAVTYTYAVFALDANGGIGASGGNFAIATGNATLSTTNYNSLTWNAAAGAVGYAVYGRISGSLTLLATVTTPAFFDQGQAFATAPDWLPAAVPSNAGLADWLVTSISSGGGTTALTLANSATTSVSGGFVRHDDTVAVQAAFNLGTTNGIPIFLGASSLSTVYWTSSALTDTAGSGPLTLYGSNYQSGPIIVLSSISQDGIDITKNGTYLHDFHMLANNGSVFNTAGALIHFASGLIGNQSERLFLQNGYICIVDNGGTWMSVRIDAQCSNSIYALATPGDSIIFGCYCSGLTIPGQTAAVNIFVTGDPGGLRIENNKLTGPTGSSISVTVTASDGDLFVIGNSMEGWAANGIILNRNSTPSFGNVIIVGNEIAGGGNASATAINFPNATGGWLSYITIDGNTIQVAGASSVGVVMGAANGFYVGGNIFVGGSTGIQIAAAATNCGIGFNTFAGTTTQITDNSAACIYAQVTAVKPTYPFLLRRDLDPAANDNRPMWINDAA